MQPILLQRTRVLSSDTNMPTLLTLTSHIVILLHFCDTNIPTKLIYVTCLCHHMGILVLYEYIINFIPPMKFNRFVIIFRNNQNVKWNFFHAEGHSSIL